MRVKCIYLILLFCALGFSSCMGAERAFERLGAEEDFIVYKTPNRADILFIMDTSPSMRALWKTNAVQSGIHNWLQMMTQVAGGAQQHFDYYIYVTSPVVLPSGEQNVPGYGGAFSAATHTAENDFYNKVVSGINHIADVQRYPVPSIWDVIVMALENMEANYTHRFTTQLKIVLFVDDVGNDDSGQSINAVTKVIDDMTSFSVAEIVALVLSPEPGKAYYDINDIKADLRPDSPAGRAVELCRFFPCQVHALDRDGITHNQELFEQTFVDFGRDASSLSRRLSLRTDVTVGIVSITVNDKVVDPDDYEYVCHGPSCYVEFTGELIPGAKYRVNYR